MPPRPQMILRSRELLSERMADRYNTVTLAAEVGVSKQLIQYLKSGARSSCRRETAERICRALGCPVGDLFSLPLEEESSNSRENGRLLLTIPQAGKAIGASPSHVYRLIAAGELASTDISLPGSSQPKSRVPVESVNAWIAKRTVAAAS